MINFTLYRSDQKGNQKNGLFPTKVVVSDKPSLGQAILFDHVTAQYQETMVKMIISFNLMSSP